LPKRLNKRDKIVLFSNTYSKNFAQKYFYILTHPCKPNGPLSFNNPNDAFLDWKVHLWVCILTSTLTSDHNIRIISIDVEKLKQYQCE